jgi:hypothetical protein
LELEQVLGLVLGLAPLLVRRLVLQLVPKLARW